MMHTSHDKEPRLVPVESAAPRLGRHPITLRADMRAGRVPGTKIGGRWFISSTVLDRITAGEPVEQPPA